MRFLFFFILSIASITTQAQDKAFEKLYAISMEEYSALHIPDTQLDYSENFAAIQNDSALSIQQEFFSALHGKLKGFDPAQLSHENKIKYKHLLYEIDQHTTRITLEKKWNASGQVVPPDGLHSMANYADWYSYYVTHFTGVNVGPDEVFEIGQKEVARAKREIERIRKALGFVSETEFYEELKQDKFFINSKPEIVSRFKTIDSTVRKNLSALFNAYDIARIEAMEWPGANASTPPGIYLSKNDNPYGVDVFQFNFSTGRYNQRCMEWLFMHEAIPGHHLQSSTRKNDNALFYFGTVEGWACYVEDLGKELGLYKNNYSLLGKEEWNLVRSARLVMEVGIHYKGWHFDEAMSYWKENIVDQDDIAGREIRRITNWPGQALCYKIGALTIQKIISGQLNKGLNIKQAHDFILRHSQYPLEALL